MTRQEQVKLRTKIRETILALRLEGVKVTAAALAQAVRERHADLVESEKERLFLESIKSRFREIARSSSNSMKSAQFMLPMALAEVRLPDMLALVPPAMVNTETGEKIVPDDVEWRSTEEVTFHELRLHLQHLLRSIENDRARYEALAAVELFLRPHMDNDEHRDDAIGPMLTEIALKEAEDGSA